MRAYRLGVAAQMVGMLGTFLEFSVGVASMREAVDLYASLGFKSLEVGDIVAHPYVAFGDGRIAVGLHERDLPATVLTFVRPDLEQHVRALKRAGVALEFRALERERFHRAGFVAECGQRVLLVEARTFSPATLGASSVTGCGQFLEYSLATASLEASAAFWERLGFERVARGDAPHRWLRLHGRGLSLGLHETAGFRTAITFRAAQLDARMEYLRAKGVSVTAGAPVAAPGEPSAVLAPPAGPALYLLGADG